MRSKCPGSDCEREIYDIQRSTRTLFPAFVPLHDRLRLRYAWYYNWHIFPYARFVHWGILLLYLVGIPFIFFRFPQEKSRAIDYEFPKWETTDLSSSSTGLNKIKVQAADCVYAVGSNGSIMKYNGTTWQKLSGTGSPTVTPTPTPEGAWIPKVYASDVITEGLYGLTVVDCDTAWVAGMSGKIYKTTDGTTWTGQTSGTSNNLYGMTSLDANTVWAVGADGTIRYTANGGTNWGNQASGTTASLYGIAAINANNVWTVGADGTILKFDGANWAAQTSGVSTSLRDVTAVNANTLFASGASNTILKTTDGGVNWTNVSPTLSGDYWLAGITAVDANNVWAVGSYGPGNKMVLATTDGGATWIQKTSISAHGSTTLNGVSALDNNNIWASAIAASGGGYVFKMSRPSYSTATNYALALPGQTFTDGAGVSGTASEARAGEAYTMEIHAVTSANAWDKRNGSWASFYTGDPSDTEPSSTQLTRGGTCNQAVPGVGTECGYGTAAFDFHTTGSIGISVIDPYYYLSTAQTTVTVIPGVAKNLYFEAAPPASLGAGTVSSLVTVGVKDKYNNKTYADGATSVNLSTNATKGWFSTGADGPWSQSLAVTLPAGNKNSLSQVSFYYLDFTTGAKTLTASGGGLTAAAAGINITAGSLAGSTFTIDRTTAVAGETINATVTLKNNGAILSGKTVALYSSRGSNEHFTTSNAVTNASGAAYFTIGSTKAGAATILAKDVTDNVYVAQDQDISFRAGAVNKIATSGLPASSEAGQQLNFTAILQDAYDN